MSFASIFLCVEKMVSGIAIAPSFRNYLAIESIAGAERNSEDPEKSYQVRAGLSMLMVVALVVVDDARK
jgi:hypothetical protein